MKNKTEELEKELREYPEDDVIRAELKGRQEREKEILKLIEDKVYNCKELGLKECKRCFEELKSKLKNEEKKLEAQLLNEDDTYTVQEYFQLGLTDDGTFFVNYGAVCQVCKSQWVFEEEGIKKGDDKNE